MNQLSEPTINNEEVFENVAQSKTYKNDHCKMCCTKKKIVRFVAMVIVEKC